MKLKKTKHTNLDPQSSNKSFFQFDKTFNNFLCDDYNKITVQALQNKCRNVTDEPAYLLIQGPSGTGKSHLLSAMANRVIEKDKNLKVIYISSEMFAMEYIKSRRYHLEKMFLRGFTVECDVLILDCATQIETSTLIFAELIEIIKFLVSKKKSIIMATDSNYINHRANVAQLFDAIPMLDSVDVEHPGSQILPVLAQNLAKKKGLKLSQDSILFLLDISHYSLTDLVGHLDRLKKKYSSN